MMTPDPERVPDRDTSSWPAELFTLPNHPALKSQLAPHETSGLLRAQRAGFSGAKLASAFKLVGSSLMAKLQEGLDQEGKAAEAKLCIHDDSELTRADVVNYLEEAEAS